MARAASFTTSLEGRPHARSAIGVAALPHGAAVEIELSVAIAR